MVHILGEGDQLAFEFAKKCSAAGGIPQYVPDFGGKPLDETIGKKHKLKPHVVLVRCWGAGKEVKGGIIYGISDKVYEQIISEKGEWKQFVKEV